MIEEYQKNQSDEEQDKQICCDENTPCVTNNSNNNDELLTNNTLSVESSQYKVKYQNSVDYLHNGENRHSSKLKEESDNEKLISNLKAQIKDELEEHEKEQQILLKDNKQNIIDFLFNKDSIRIEDLKIYEPIYKCYREKEDCNICNASTNIVCVNCNNYNNKEAWLCTNHWQKHSIDKDNNNNQNVK